MMQAIPQISQIQQCLAHIGYQPGWFKQNVVVGNDSHRVPLVAFSGPPFDARTACISAISGNCVNDARVSDCRAIAAPLTIVAGSSVYEIWRHVATSAEPPQRIDVISPTDLIAFFERNRDELSPTAIYRAKVWGRVQPRQLDFVDAGLLPLLEAEEGQRITDLMVHTVNIAKEGLGWTEPSVAQGQWLLKSVFWLLAAKILQDKHVDRFIRLDLEDIDTVFERLSVHYNSGSPMPREVGRHQRNTLAAAAREIKQFAHLGLLSIEALAYLYESALIDKATRQKLGTHSTPSWMVDYMIGKLRPWVTEMEAHERRVFEPACGHGGFLIGALRLLSELRPLNYHEDHRTYLRKRLRGIEIDPFAVEIARLSLTLADVPNPNGWALTTGDMFQGDVLARESQAATIVLSNPPFEKFSSVEQQDGWQYSKAAETFGRVFQHLPMGAVYGFILPVNVLTSKQNRDLRKNILSHSELAEISLFADKVFRYGEPESAVIIGRKVANVSANRSVSYQRVREKQIEHFKQNFAPSSTETYLQTEFLTLAGESLLVPELSNLWSALSSHPRLESVVEEIGKGLEYLGEDDLPRDALKESNEERPGFAQGFAKWSEATMTHELPQNTWLNLDSRVIRRPLCGCTIGVAQILLNYAPVSREPWCIKALVDRSGHAVTTRFLVLRPKAHSAPLLAWWALMNSPLANAFAFSHSTKREILGATLKQMPFPNVSWQEFADLEKAVETYFSVVQRLPQIARQNQSQGARRTNSPSGAEQQDLFMISDSEGRREPLSTLDEDELRTLHWRIDAEVLKLYRLPSELERLLLSFFTGVQRRGVPFQQLEYFPRNFNDLCRLSDLLAITSDWQIHDARKAELVERKVLKLATTEELQELDGLKLLTSARRSLYAPLPLTELAKVKADLIRKGRWLDE